MASPNIYPLYTVTADVANDGSTAFAATILTATADYTGISANHKKVFTAGANGSYIRKIRFRPLGTNAVTVARIYLNNGATQATATNNSPFGALALPATTASNTVADGPDIDYVMEIAIPNGFTVWVGLATTVAAGWACTAIGGKY